MNIDKVFLNPPRQRAAGVDGVTMETWSLVYHNGGKEGCRGLVKSIWYATVGDECKKILVVGDAENINKQARNERKDWLNSSARANWVKNKQEANGFLRSAPVGGARAA